MDHIGDFRMTWNAKNAGFKELYFPTLTHLLKYYNCNAVHFSCPVQLWVWTGRVYERFVIYYGKVISKSRLERLLMSITD